MQEKYKIIFKSATMIVLFLCLMFWGFLSSLKLINGVLYYNSYIIYNYFLNVVSTILLTLVIILTPYLIIRYFKNGDEKNKKLLTFWIVSVIVIWILMLTLYSSLTDMVIGFSMFTKTTILLDVAVPHDKIDHGYLKVANRTKEVGICNDKVSPIYKHNCYGLIFPEYKKIEETIYLLFKNNNRIDCSELLKNLDNDEKNKYYY